MRLEKLKFKYSTTSILVKSSLDIINKLATFKWGDIPNTIIEVKKEKLDLLINETKFPGKELAFIYKIKHEL
jgi:hypothetical protein